MLHWVQMHFSQINQWKACFKNVVGERAARCVLGLSRRCLGLILETGQPRAFSLAGTELSTPGLSFLLDFADSLLCFFFFFFPPFTDVCSSFTSASHHFQKIFFFF